MADEQGAPLTFTEGDLSALQALASNVLGQMQGTGTNPLDRFQTFNSLFTLACLNRAQQNSGDIKRENIENVIARSQGDWGDKSKRVGTDFGSFDYFIDDVNIVSIPSPSLDTGNTFATKVTFKVIEPYSMGLFLLTMQQAAAKAGFKLNFKEAPYVLMVEFVGNVNSLPSSSEPGPDLTRYIPIKITSAKFNVGSAGSIYEIEAIPYNEHAFRDHIVKSVTDVQISGKTVREILLDGPTSLQAQLENKYYNDQQLRNVYNADRITIQFPKSYTDQVGIDNEIGNAKLYENFETTGSQPFLDYDQIFFEGKHVIRKNAFRMEDDKSWHFVQEISIPDIITEVIIRSDYIKKQIVGTQFQTDENGMVNWFRIEGRIRDLDDNPQLGRQQRIIDFRVVPYKVHVHKFLPPDVKPPKYDNLRRSVSRVYDYIYTGRNTEILKVDLNFDLAYFTPVPADAAERVGQNTPGTAGLAAGGQEIQSKFPETATQDSLPVGGTYAFQTNIPLTTGTAADDRFNAFMNFQNQARQEAAKSSRPEIKNSSNPTANRDFFYKGAGGMGGDNEQTSQVRTMQALLTNNADMINLNMEIMGDPYYLPSSGMGNQVKGRRGSNLLDDGSMNYQESEVDIIINFKTPIDIDLQTGLYRFEKTLDMWSGLYQVIQVESRFQSGKFTQNIKGIRRRTQYGGAKDAKSIFLEEQGRTAGSAGDNGGYGGQGAGSSQASPNYSAAGESAGIPQAPQQDILTQFGRNFF